MSRKTLLPLVLPVLAIFMPKAHADEILQALSSPDQTSQQWAIDAIRKTLKTEPAAAVDRLNENWMTALATAKRYDAVNEFALAGTLALPADTWRIEQLQKHRVRALIEQHRPAEAVRAARSLFNVCGMSFVKEALELLSQSMEAANPLDASKLHRFKAQILAASQENAQDRERLLAKWGGTSVISSLSLDSEPYESTIGGLSNVSGYRGLCGLGNLLLMSGRLSEARATFDKAAAVAPPEERVHVLETAARLMKAEDGGVGRANQYVRSLVE